MSEGGVMGAIGALTGAVNDALAPFGVVADTLAAQPPVPARACSAANNLIEEAEQRTSTK